MRALKSYSRGQWTVLRILLGVYLLAGFAQEFPQRYTFFGNAGVLPLTSLPVLLPAGVAELYARVWSDAWVDALFAGRLAFAALILAGFYSRLSAAALFAVQFLLLNRNIATVTPEVCYINWLLLATVAIPANRSSWFMPRTVYAAGWIMLAGNYLYSAFSKLSHVRWREGIAMSDFLHNPMAVRAWAFPLTAAVPSAVALGLTYAVLLVELSGPAAILFSASRRAWWAASLLMHLGAMLIFPIAQISTGLLVFHFFLFDERWIHERA
jgi:hypothetical protein